MNEGKNIEERIDAYFNGRLSKEALGQFELDLQTDNELRKQFDFAKEVYESIQDTEAIQFEKNVSDVINANKSDGVNETTSGKRRYLYMIGMAASFVLLFGVWQLFFTEPASAQELFAQNYKTYILSTPRGDSTADWRKIYAMYADQRYEEFINEVEDDKGKHRMQDFYLSMAYMETGQAKKAQSLLSELAKVQHPQFTDASIWYLALANLQLGNIEAAKIELERLNDFKGLYHRKAKKLLKAMK